jgi:hypothetical protein
MIFPFGNNPPKKDYSKVLFDFVITKSKLSRFFLIIICKLVGYDIDTQRIMRKRKYTMIGIPKDMRLHKVTTGFNVYVMAEQSYHGAFFHKNIFAFLKNKIFR